jgi:hypothetical protein
MQSFCNVDTLVQSCDLHWYIVSILYIDAEILCRTLVQSFCAVHWYGASVLYTGQIACAVHCGRAVLCTDAELLCCTLVQIFSGKFLDFIAVLGLMISFIAVLCYIE